MSEQVKTQAPRRGKPRTLRGVEPPARRRGDIQGMRAVAVVLVMLSHAKIAGFAGGYVGVDVFFVISGFLITGILAREVSRTGRVSIAGFYARRALRILPAATVALLGICIASAAVYTSNNLHLVLTDVAAAAVFAANINYALAGTDYFSTNAFVSPVQHFWSLAVEEQFYLVWPALVGLVMYLGARSQGAGGTSRPATRTVALRRAGILVLALAGISFLWSRYDTGANPQMAYYSTFTRTWELSLGALLALGAGGISRLPDVVKRVASWGGLLAIMVAACTYDASTPFPGSHAALPVVGAALVLGGGIDGPRSGARVLLDTRPMRWVGNISFSLYLWHWPLLILPEAYLVRDLALHERLLAMFLAVVLAWLSYRWVESPFHHPNATPSADAQTAPPAPAGLRPRTGRRNATSAGRRSVTRALLLWPAAVAVVLAFVGSVWVYDARQGSADAARQAATYAKADSSSEATDLLVSDVATAAGLARQDAPLPATLQPALTDLFGDITFPTGACSASKAADVTQMICPIGDVGSSRTIVLWGDSHIGMWMRPLEQLAKERGYKIITFTKASCVPVDELEWYHDRPYVECAQFRSWALDQIKRIKPDQVVISGYLGTPLVDESRSKPIPSGEDYVQFAGGAKRMLARLHSALPATRVSVIGDVRVLEQDAGKCLGSKKATMGTCVGPMTPSIAGRNQGWRTAAAATGAHYIDLSPYFCAAQTCPIVIRNTIVYRDSNHITSTYALRLKPVLRDQLGL